ncbi:MAG: sigma-70 family RNA polymerase sigma factor [Pseudomonadota bacterium]
MRERPGLDAMTTPSELQCTASAAENAWKAPVEPPNCADAFSSCYCALGDDAALARMRKELLRFAVLQLRNRELAEDVVQEVLASALAASARFDPRASVRSWLFTILKHKIVDVFRDRWHKDRVELVDDRLGEDELDQIFTANERWQRDEMPTSWGNPEQSFENMEFWRIFEICMNSLPPAMARVFSMREFLGMEAADICTELNITPANCWVILYRARMILRLCLQKRWFEKDEMK